MLQDKMRDNVQFILGIAASTLFTTQIAMADSGGKNIELSTTCINEKIMVESREECIGSSSIKCDCLSEPEPINLGTPINCDGNQDLQGINVCEYWDIDINPDGNGLPDGEGTPIKGKQLYKQQCAECHGIAGINYGTAQGEDWTHNKSGKYYPNLCGGQGTLTTDNPQKTVGSYWPYATTLFDYIRRTMPFWNPQSFHDDEVYAVVAYLLYLNGIIDKDQKIDKSSLLEVEMPNKDGFFVPSEELKNMSSDSEKPIGVGTSDKKGDTPLCLQWNEELEVE
jgi:cytochrome c